jgi:murein DD-endopeptidase MepM/ murein hydrolase activator NlpD
MTPRPAAPGSRKSLMSQEKDETPSDPIEENADEADAPDSTPDDASAADDGDEAPAVETTKPSAAKLRERREQREHRDLDADRRDMRPPATELRLRRLPPSEPDRSRLYGAAAIGALVLIGIALIVASPAKKIAPASPALALTSGDLDAGTASVAVVERKEAAAAPPAPIVRPPPVWRVASMKDEPGVDVVEGTFGKKGLVGTLTAAGLARAEIKRLTKAFEDVKHIDRPGANDKFVLAKDKKNRILAFEYVASPFDVWQAKADAEDLEKAKDAGAKDPGPELEAKKLDFFVEHKRVASAFVIAADLAKTIAAANLRPELVDEIDDALEGHVEDGVKSGSRMRIVSTEDVVDGVVARTKLEAVELVPRAGNPVRVYFYERGPEVEGSAKQKPVAGFYDGKGRQPYHGQFRAPLQLSRVTSRFNPNRMHPVLHVVTPHNGVDYRGAPGTPIYASAAGTVISAGDSGPCGNMVSIDHGGGLTTAYCHMSRIAPGIHAGVKVEQRQNIGFVGQTGRVTGPHLHFVVKRNGAFIDPLSLKMDGVRVLPPADRDAFAKKRGELDVAIDGIALPAAPAAKDDPPDEEDKDLHE